MQHLQHGLVNKHMMTSIPEKGREKAWRFSCQNQEMLLIRRCERCKQSTNAQDRGISHSHSIIYSSRSGCMQAAAQHPVSHPGELSQRFLNMAKTEGPLSSGGLSLWRLMSEQRMHSTMESHNAALTQHLFICPLLGMKWSVCKLPMSISGDTAFRKDLCVESSRRAMEWVIRNQNRQLPKPETPINTDYGDMVKIKHNVLT